MYWTSSGNAAEWEQHKGAVNRQALENAIATGQVHALLAVDEDQPVGWCRFGPVGEFSRLMRARTLQRPDMADWAIVCLFVARDFRRRGVATALVAAAAVHAFGEGARAIEGYAVVPRSGPVPEPFAWTGVPSIFEEAGFTALEQQAGARRIYLKQRQSGARRPMLETGGKTDEEDR